MVVTVVRTQFAYTEDGLLDMLTYPECFAGPCAGTGPARTVNYDYSKGFQTKVNGYATDFDYQYGGMLHQITYAHGATWEQTVDPANHIPRPQKIDITTDNGTTTFGNYDYDGAGNITAIGSLNFEYDLLSRLTSGQARDSSSTLRTQTASFDTYGNLTTLTMAGSTQSLTADTATNRLAGTGMAYDEAGNLTNATVGGSQFQYTWDGLNSMKFYQSELESKVFSYDAAGERLETFRCPGSSCGVGESYERLTLRGLAGEVLRVFQTSEEGSGWVEDYVYAAGRPLARVRNDAFDSGGETPVTEYLHLDHLGSVRMVTDASNAEVAYHEYFPFGEEATNASSDDSKLKFTGHERDDGSGSSDELDYMHARYCGPLLGRFLSVDPDSQSVSQGLPQTLNRYSYVLNNPLRLVDPFGEKWFPTDEGWIYLEGVSTITEIVVSSDGLSEKREVEGLDMLVSFDGDQVSIHREDGTTITFPAVSGVVDDSGKTQPDLQAQENVGPIPEGEWSFDRSEIQRLDSLNQALGLNPLRKSGSWPGGMASWGIMRVFLTPAEGTNTYSRSGFAIHGGYYPGSAGCIDLCRNEVDFFDSLGGGTSKVPVFVDYD